MAEAINGYGRADGKGLGLPEMNGTGDAFAYSFQLPSVGFQVPASGEGFTIDPVGTGDGRGWGSGRGRGNGHAPGINYGSGNGYG